MVYRYLILEGEISQVNFAAFSSPAEFAADSQEEARDLGNFLGQSPEIGGIGEMGGA
jgi:hypothetical protein